jgi:dimeric dUTPase (all-alpha-NTP-PPase superfamily)
MNLERLFELQKALDERIVKEHGLQGVDLLPNKMLALKVELGELANEWRGFKHWSYNKKPRHEKMLEEYVDCLHFLLSIGLELDVKTQPGVVMYQKNNVIDQFETIFHMTCNIKDEWEWGWTFGTFVGLGEMLGFSWDEIEAAYLAKNEVNLARQEMGY